MRPVPRVLALLALIILPVCAGPVHALPKREPPLLLGGARPVVKKEVPIDPLLPTGARIEYMARPEGFERLCSNRAPVCAQLATHAPASLSLTRAQAALEALENAYDRLVVTLGLPQPLADSGAGGTHALDAYLFPPEHALLVTDEANASAAFTQSSGFCALPVPEDALLLQRNASLCVAEAIALALDASEPPHLRRAFATWLWWAIGTPGAHDCEVVDRVQAHPELAIATRDVNPTSEGAALFFEYLETVRSGGGIAELSAGLFAASVSEPRPIESHYKNVPDMFDVLRHSLEDDRARFAELMVGFAAARAFIGSRDDGVHLPTLGWAGEFARPRFDWSLRFSSLPRRVSLSPPVDSTGTGLLWIDIDEELIGAALGVHVEWEPPVSFHFQIIKLSADGREMGRVDVPYRERAREADMRVSDLLGVRSVLIVGTNLEGIDLSHPFDPDVAPFEPHGVTVYAVRM